MSDLQNSSAISARRKKLNSNSLTLQNLNSNSLKFKFKSKYQLPVIYLNYCEVRKRSHRVLFFTLIQNGNGPLPILHFLLHIKRLQCLPNRCCV